MLDKLKQLDNRYSELGQRMENGEIYADPTAYTKCAREMKELEPIVTAYREYVKCEKAMKDAEELMSDPEFKELAQEEYNDAKQRLASLASSLRFCSCQKTRTMSATSLWRSAPASAERKARFLRMIFSACIPCMQRVRAGR